MSQLPSLFTKTSEEPDQERQQQQQLSAYLGFSAQQQYIQMNINGSSYPQTSVNQQQIYNESDANNTSATLKSYFASYRISSDEEDSIQQQLDINTHTPLNQINTFSNNEVPLQNPLYHDHANIYIPEFTHMNQNESITVPIGEQEQQFNRLLPLNTGYADIANFYTADTYDQYATQELPQQVYLAPSTEKVTAAELSTNNTDPRNYVNSTTVPAQTVKLSNGRIKCIPCNKDFANNGYATQHNNIHHSGDLSHRCDHCGKRFSTKERMVAHRTFHDIANKPFKCQDCDKRYARKSDLQRHCTTKHEGIKKFTCDVCMKIWGRNDQLLKHKQTHLKTKKASNDPSFKQ